MDEPTKSPEDAGKEHLSLIKTLLTKIYKLKQVRKEDKKALMDELMADGNFKSLTEQLETLRVARNKAKLNVLAKNPTAATINDRIGSANSEIKDYEESLFAHMASYYELTGEKYVNDGGYEFRMIPHFKLDVRQLDLFDGVDN